MALTWLTTHWALRCGQGALCGPTTKANALIDDVVGDAGGLGKLA